MFIVGAFYESQDGGGQYHYLKAVPDPQLATEDDQLRVPVNMPNLVGMAALTAATTITAARIESPSLSRVIYPNIKPIVEAVKFGDIPAMNVLKENLLPLAGDESLRAAINSDAAAAVSEYVIVWFSDSQISESKGQIFSIRATSAIIQSAGAWVNGKMTFQETLPVGEYDVVGLRAEATSLVAARLNFIGLAHRPGVPAVNTQGDKDLECFRFGKFGVFGRFHSTTPPSVDLLGITNTSQEYILDLIKVG